MWLIAFSLIICFLYLILISVFIIGWEKTSDFEPNGNESVDIKISVVIPCRNEEHHLRRLLSSLAQQSYRNFELIFVNDHSTDTTKKIIEKVQPEFSNLRLIDATGFGKKNALKEGIKITTGNLIVTTDADCIPSFLWLESIACFQNDSPGDLIICPVKLSVNSSLLSSLQTLEFISLVASGAGAAGAGMPILCNGANLAFTKETWLTSQADLHEEVLSGDDIFLLESVKKRGGIIRFLKSESAFVVTDPAQSFSAFLHQRRRWASKSPSFTDWQLILTACIVFTISLLPFLLIGFSVCNSQFWSFVLLVFGFKYLLDTSFLYSVRVFFQLKHVWIYSFLLSLVYPFYIVLVSVSSLILKPKSWN
jgi:cellulose synthase/poly-beta-1,6-N-acetylglucosamine synthase-like glycosyltransferase